MSGTQVDAERRPDAGPPPQCVGVGVGRWMLFWAIALGGMAFDLTTKTMIFERVGPPPSPVVSLLRNVLELQTNYNSGALWGLGRNLPHSHMFFASLSIFAAGAICYWLFVRGAASDWRLTIALGLIMAGALGNCYDRLMLGHVRDFVHFHVDPVGFDCAIFNFADNMLVIGAILLMLLALRPEHHPAPASSETCGETQAAPPAPESVPVP
jgi:signal peptidase II